MKRELRLYNVIFPIWLLFLFPVVLILVIPANLAMDSLVLLLTLLALKHDGKRAVLKHLWWKFWLLGFAADGVGVLWMLLGFLPFQNDALAPLWSDTLRYIMHNPFGHPAAFLWTLVGVVLAGVCIYCFDMRAMKSCSLLSGAEKHTIALTMAIVTAPWLFFIPTYR